MNELIAELIKDAIVNASLEWVDKIAGLVKPVTIQVRTADGTDVLRTFPVACIFENPDCTAEIYDDFVPNDARRSIIYLEDGGTRYEPLNSRVIQGTSDLRLICWMNINQLGSNDCTKSAIMVQNLLATIPAVLPATAPLYNIQVTFEGEQPKTADIFSRYSYFEEVNQYLMYPYDYFALNLQVKYRFPIDCNVPLNCTCAVCP